VSWGRCIPLLRAYAAAFATVALVAAAPELRSHPLDPSLLELRESAVGEIQVLWRTPLLRAGDRASETLVPVLPDSCRALGAAEAHEAAATATLRWKVDCGPEGLEGARVGVEGLDVRGTDALLRAELLDGRRVQAVLRSGAAFFTIPDKASAFATGRGYLILGFEHILGGADHLLFVLGLVLLVQGGRRLLWTITAFTLGHSVTLSLAALGFLDLPPAPIEVLIAASIFFVAVQLIQDGRTRAARTYSAVIAGAFGLLHGLGFAGALAQVGLPAREIPLALFSFNVGIELGQLVFVGAVLVLRYGLTVFPVHWPPVAARVPAYAIGSFAAFWVLERFFDMLRISGNG
jgi:hypothetical protein